MVTRMSLTELHEATGNFNTGNVIGLGKFRMMYKGVLPNGWPHAIKRLHDSKSFEKQLVSELLVLAKGRTKIFEWPSRIKIAIGVARGLAWLHHDRNFPVVYLNLSSNSILLDHNFKPKIPNFGVSIISNFGGEMFKNPRGNNIFIGSDVWELGSSNLYNVIDESLIGQGFEDEIFELLTIAYTCLKLFPSRRPTTLELYNTIRIFGERDRLTHNSEILRQFEIATASNFGEIDIDCRG
uniref:Protein kinase domain-containing protein n=1 Tax=Quercus lobata TaxID=97700 RepID=A0A7N2MTE8_QUELO